MQLAYNFPSDNIQDMTSESKYMAWASVQSSSGIILSSRARVLYLYLLSLFRADLYI